ncbi:MAG: flagellar hook-associated protein FlgK [Burkholderiaceae bacterium]
MPGVFDIGKSALQAAYTQLQTASNNIANASTPGYSRREVVLSEAGSVYSGQGYIGMGVKVDTIRRSYDQYLAREVQSATAINAADGARQSVLEQLDRVFSDSQTSIGAAFDDLRVGLADLVNRPFDPSARAVATQRADVLAARVRDTYGQLQRLRGDTRSMLDQSAETLNSRLAALASVNDQIAALSASSHAPNDLLDRRDALVTEINGYIRSSSVLNDDGTVSLYASTGDALVLGGKASTLAISDDANEPGRLRVTLQSNGQALVLSDRMLGGGELAGLMRFVNEDLREAEWGVGQFAAGISEAFRAQQALGLDADGTAGAAVFGLSPAQVDGGTGNAGSAQLSAAIVDGAALAASDYRIDIRGGQFVFTRLSDGQETSFGSLPQQLDGLEIRLDTGAVAEGDSFVVRGASSFAGEFRRVLAGPSGWAAGSANLPTLGVTNQGSLQVDGFQVDAADPNLAASVTLSFDGAGRFDVNGPGTGNPTGLTYTPGQDISFNGWTLRLQGQPQAGDTVVLAPPADALADNRNARALLEIAERGVVGGETPGAAYSNLIAGIGTRTQGAQSSAMQSSMWLQGAQSALEQQSGVNLDEEAARLLEFQQAYQAAAKVISTAQAMFDSLLAATAR